MYQQKQGNHQIVLLLLIGYQLNLISKLHQDWQAILPHIVNSPFGYSLYFSAFHHF